MRCPARLALLEVDGRQMLAADGGIEQGVRGAAQGRRDGQQWKLRESLQPRIGDPTASSP